MSKRVARTEQIVNPEGNTRVDLVGAIAVGLGIPLYNLLFVLPSFGHITSEFVVFVLTNTGAYILVTLMLSHWRGVLRVRAGWILIVIAGSVVSAAAHNFFRREDSDAMFRDFSLFPLEVIFFTFIGLIIMVIVQSIGFVTKAVRGNKSVP